MPEFEKGQISIDTPAKAWLNSDKELIYLSTVS